MDAGAALPGHPRAAVRELPPRASRYCSATSGRGSVAPLDRPPDPGSALARVEVGLRLDLRGLVGQARVLDLLAEPARVVAPAQVVEPGRVVDPVGDLVEEREVLGPQVELAVRAAEIEAVRAEVALGVLADVPTALGAGGGDAEAEAVAPAT